VKNAETLQSLYTHLIYIQNKLWKGRQDQNAILALFWRFAGNLSWQTSAGKLFHIPCTVTVRDKLLKATNLLIRRNR